MKDGMEERRIMKENGRREWKERMEEENGRKRLQQIWQDVRCLDTADS